MRNQLGVLGCAVIMAACGKLAPVESGPSPFIAGPSSSSSSSSGAIDVEPPWYRGQGSSSGSGPALDPSYPQVPPSDVPIVAEVSGQSSCASRIPPSPSTACEITMPSGGLTWYVSSKNGKSGNSGLSPDAPFASLYPALVHAASGSSILVAEGDYPEAEIRVTRGVGIKGGFDPSFKSWNPEQHPTRLYGKLALSNDDAVVGGFRLIGHDTTNRNGTAFHMIAAGALVRNHIEVIYEAGPEAWGTYAIVPAAEAGHTTRLSCNDIYVRQTGQSAILGAVEYGNVALHAGNSLLELNRICNDSEPMQIATALAGYGTCPDSGASSGPGAIVAHDNIFEVAQPARGGAVDFYDCGRPHGLDLTFSHNTFISASDGIGAAGGTEQLDYRFTDNIFVGRSGWGSSSAVTTTLYGTASNNLVFGFDDSSFPLDPAASQPQTDASEVFVDPSNGNYAPKSSARGARIP